MADTIQSGTERTLRPYQDRDRHAVSDLFVRVNRELAPRHLREAFENYIALSLRKEIGIIPEYYDPQRGRSFWVVTEGDRLLGTFGLEPVDEVSIELRRMYVESAFRGKGLGRWMLDQAEAICRRCGWKTMVLSTSELQSAALALYRSHGFILVREEFAAATTNKTVGQGIKRFYFSKALVSRF
jgi:GNAT superfamily N-acetyltransferase